MTTERFGFFNADSEGASFIAAFEIDLNDFPTWASMHTTVEKMVLDERNGSYLIYSDAKTMESDEGERERDFYDLYWEELDSKPYTVVESGDDRAALELIMAKLADGGDIDLSATETATYLANYDQLVAEAAATSAANSTVHAGTPIYRACVCGIGYPDARATLFDPRLHDISKSLLESEVDYTLGKTAVKIIHSLPPHLAKKNGKFWASMKNDNAYFMGQSHSAISRKAAIHLAWTVKFGAH